MEVQVKSLSNNLRLQQVALGVIIFNGILHLAFGAAYISAGNPYSNLSMASLMARTNGEQGAGAFLIISGLFQMGIPLMLYWNLVNNKSNKLISSLSWLCSVLTALFNFSSVILMIQIYSPIARYLAKSDLSISDLVESSSRNMLRYALANSIITFLVGWPCTLYIVIACSYNRSRVGADDHEEKSQENRENPYVNEQPMQNYEGLNDTGNKTIDLQKNPYVEYERREQNPYFQAERKDVEPNHALNLNAEGSSPRFMAPPVYEGQERRINLNLSGKPNVQLEISQPVSRSIEKAESRFISPAVKQGNRQRNNFSLAARPYAENGPEKSNDNSNSKFLAPTMRQMERQQNAQKFPAENYMPQVGIVVSTPNFYATSPTHPKRRSIDAKPKLNQGSLPQANIGNLKPFF